MDPLTLLLPIGTVAGIVLTVLTIREKLKPKGPHPLEVSLRDIAAAIRDVGYDLITEMIRMKEM